MSQGPNGPVRHAPFKETHCGQGGGHLECLLQG
eukprot:CAMPEP_0171094472 /NCGR_PEP_ID=MMETSP0766_2-20121228/41251_1 /TAXON_ID=439317 /ORGANISM="Gambierdiscus australes, Strain CAWD 149" /LENGTH=32 /DNA_ID= /DNA_START= /DNA_END= /DNA_ORIENTATION=